MNTPVRKAARLLIGVPVEQIDPPPSDLNLLPKALWILGGALLCGILMFSCTAIPAHAYTDDQIANAIYLAEGGQNAKQAYGIKAIKCKTRNDCRRVCLRTIKNNRIRYSKYDRRRSEDFISYLSRVYCPIEAKNGIEGNKNWLKNVQYFLSKGNRNGKSKVNKA